MFRASLCPSSGSLVRILLLYTVHTACFPAPQDISHHIKCWKSYAAIYGLALLKMRIMMPETYWANGLLINHILCICPSFVSMVEASWNVMAHTHTETRFRLSAKRTSPFKSAGWRQFSRLLAAEECASAVVMLDTPCSEVVWKVLAIHSIRQFPLHFPSHASPCAITFQLKSESTCSILAFHDVQRAFQHLPAFRRDFASYCSRYCSLRCLLVVPTHEDVGCNFLRNVYIYIKLLATPP